MKKRDLAACYAEGHPLYPRIRYSEGMAPPTFVRETVRAMRGYTPGEQPSAGARVVKLNTNENPFPPSPKVMDAIRELDSESLRRYPQPRADRFRDAAANLLGVTPENIICGNGSDDILTIVMRTFVPAGGSIASPDPTYSLYSVLSQLQDARHHRIAWRDGWHLPTDELLAADADAIFLANPNAPSGTIVSAAEIESLATKFGRLVLVDEAYVDFTDHSCVDLVRKHANVVVSRTLSKGYGLAGLRFGYAVGQEQVIDQMLKVKDSYNCDALSIIAATAAIEDQAYARSVWARIREERERLTGELRKLGFTVIPSHGNFVLATVPGSDGKAFYEGLKQQGILVRFFDSPGLQDKIRVSIGSSHENAALVAGVMSLIEKSKAA